MALTCLQAWITEAREKDRFLNEQRGLPFESRPSEQHFSAELRRKVRQMVETKILCDEAKLLDLDLTVSPGRDVANYLLDVLSRQAHDPLAMRFMERTSTILAEAWKEGRRPRARYGTRADDDEDLDVELEHQIVEHLTRFVLELDAEAALKVCQPVIELTADRPQKVAEFLNYLMLNEEKRAPTKTLWVLWQKIADDLIAHGFPATQGGESATDDEDDEDSESNSLLRQLFLNLPWAKDTRDWAPLHGEAHRICDLFVRLPPSRPATRSYACFLAKVGSPTLPDALCYLAAKLHLSDSRNLLSADAVWYLETILSRLISGGNRQVRSEAGLRQSILDLLDDLVDAGSSVAYKLRDDFVTPASVGS